MGNTHSAILSAVAVLVAGGAPLLAADSRPCPRARVEPEPEAEPGTATGFGPVAVAVAASGPSAGLAEPGPGPIATIAGDVAFEFDSARLRPEFHPVLDGLAAALRQNPSEQLALTGHTDAIGPEPYNTAIQ